MDDFAPDIKTLLAKALHLIAYPRDPNSLQDEAMQLAFLAARKAHHENRGGDALKALGAFWNIYLGFLDSEPAYHLEAQTRLALAESERPTERT